MRHLILPAIAALALCVAAFHLVRAQQVPAEQPPPRPPVVTPFHRTLAAAGVVEATTENISVGSHVPGIVAEVAVKVGQRVKQGDPLFRLDARAAQAELGVRQGVLADAQAALTRLEALPRAEELPPSEARIREAQALVAEREDQRRRKESLRAERAVSDEEVVRSRQQAAQAREQLARTEADHRLLTAGAWEYDKQVARAAVRRAEAQVEQARTEVDRQTMQSPVDGQVLQVNVRPGEFVGASAGVALVVLGGIEPLHVRVDIDEHDIPRFRPTAPAQAMPRGAGTEPVTLRFVRVEPLVIPKQSLTGANRERVDTRVLPVIYAVDGGGQQSLYVGQQMDVYLDLTQHSDRTQGVAP